MQRTGGGHSLTDTQADGQPPKSCVVTPLLKVRIPCVPGLSLKYL